MTVSVVISTKDRLESLSRCLVSLRAQTRRPDELVIVDAASDPGVRALVEAQRDSFPAVSYHALPSSLTQARNHGVRSSRGDAVVFLDDDLVLEPDFLAELIRPLERDSGLAGVTGDVVGHPRGKEPVKQLFKRLFQLPCDGDGAFRRSGAPTTVHGSSEPRQVEFLPGGLTAWRREVFKDFAFDESLPGLGVNEDVDFSYRVSRRWRNFYAPKARVVHERPSLEREATPAYLRRELESAAYLRRKNLPKDPLTTAAFLWHQAGLLVRWAFRRFLRA